MPDDQIDVQSIDERTRYLLKVLAYLAAAVGLWAVWVDLVPALTSLGEVELWRYMGEVDGKPTSIAVTLTSAAGILIGVALFVVAARNLPGLVEIALLHNLPLDAGLRYAIRSILGYLIVAIGIFWFAESIGIAWSNVQWLMAALGVGLGFGLQEIFANFVSGLIILFERPVRIGDAVTVGDTTGVVSKIKVRSTTLVDWDNKEIIVPNRTFVTERLINWTLSDAVTRVVIPVGVAYGSDVRQAQEVIRTAAGKCDLVLPQPPMQLFLPALARARSTSNSGSMSAPWSTGWSPRTSCWG